jgi:hypothetical protein
MTGQNRVKICKKSIIIYSIYNKTKTSIRRLFLMVVEGGGGGDERQRPPSKMSSVRGW